MNLNHLVLFQYRVNPSFPSFSRDFRGSCHHGEGWGAVFHQFRDESRSEILLGRFVHPLQGRVSSSIKTEPDPSFEPVLGQQQYPDSSIWASTAVSRVSSSSRECKHPPPLASCLDLRSQNIIGTPFSTISLDNSKSTRYNRRKG